LGYYVNDKTLNNMTYPNIIAHCLWEMNFFGFEHKREEEGNLVMD